MSLKRALENRAALVEKLKQELLFYENDANILVLTEDHLHGLLIGVCGNGNLTLAVADAEHGDHYPPIECSSVGFAYGICQHFYDLLTGEKFQKPARN